MSKVQFLELYEAASKTTFTPSLIKSCFCVMGIVPFNRNIITPAQMAPAATDSVSGSTALELPSPVKEIMVDLAYAKKVHTGAGVVRCGAVVSLQVEPEPQSLITTHLLQDPLSVCHSRLF